MENTTVITVTDSNVTQVDKVLYTGNVHITGGRDGQAQSSDGRLSVKLSSPGKGEGTNPEQLFAAGWSACFIGAMQHSAPQLGFRMPQDVAVDTAVDLGTNETGFLLQARMQVSLPGLTTEQATALVEAAHQTCPYSKATRGNINIQINIAV